MVTPSEQPTQRAPASTAAARPSLLDASFRVGVVLVNALPPATIAAGYALGPRFDELLRPVLHTLIYAPMLLLAATFIISLPTWLLLQLDPPITRSRSPKSDAAAVRDGTWLEQVKEQLATFPRSRIVLMIALSVAAIVFSALTQIALGALRGEPNFTNSCAGLQVAFAYYLWHLLRRITDTEDLPHASARLIITWISILLAGAILLYIGALMKGPPLAEELDRVAYLGLRGVYMASGVMIAGILTIGLLAFIPPRGKPKAAPDAS